MPDNKPPQPEKPMNRALPAKLVKVKAKRQPIAEDGLVRLPGTIFEVTEARAKALGPDVEIVTE